MLGGTWVGCDDRFIRFNSTNIGQGSAAALPIWAYFFNKVYADKTLGVDRDAKFSKPETMSNDVIYDYMNNNRDYQPGAEGEDMGNGTSEDYIIPNTGAEEIGAESDVPLEKVKPGGKATENIPKDNKPPNTKPEVPVIEEENLSRRELRRLRKEKEKQEKENQQQPPPKAILPKKEN